MFICWSDCSVSLHVVRCADVALLLRSLWSWFEFCVRVVSLNEWDTEAQSCDSFLSHSSDIHITHTHTVIVVFSFAVTDFMGLKAEWSRSQLCSSYKSCVCCVCFGKFPLQCVFHSSTIAGGFVSEAVLHSCFLSLSFFSALIPSSFVFILSILSTCFAWCHVLRAKVSLHVSRTPVTLFF